MKACTLLLILSVACDSPADANDAGRDADLPDSPLMDSNGDDTSIDAARTDSGGVDGGRDGGPPREVGDPLVLFSDLTAAPNSGWSAADPQKGAVVTIWGRGFGSVRGSSYVTVNGTRLESESDYVDEWGLRSNPVAFLESITFQLHDGIAAGAGEIRVTVEGTDSNAIPFRVGEGTIYFVDSAASGGSGSLGDPWGDLSEFIDVMAPGDIAYFREGVYDERYNGGKSNIWVRDSEAGGTETQPIAFVGYPGEVAMFDSASNGDRISFNKSIQFDSPYVTIAKVSARAFGPAINVGHFGRAVGNDLIGATVFLQGTGIINASDGAIVLGNSLHGARSGNRLDHTIYLNGCSPTRGGEVAYNHSFDQVFDRGPHFVVNSQESRCSSDEQLKASYFHHNVVDCTGSPSRAVGVYDQSWDPGEANEPEPTYVYDNLIIRCGSNAMYHNNGHAVFVHNTLYETRSPAINVSGGLVLSTVLANNIITMASGEDTYVSGSPTTDNGNLYFGGDDSDVSGTNAILADPLLVPDLEWFQFGLSPESPAIDAADDSAASLVTDDFLGRPRPQGAAYDIGAFEWTE